MYTKCPLIISLLFEVKIILNLNNAITYLDKVNFNFNSELN